MKRLLIIVTVGWMALTGCTGYEQPAPGAGNGPDAKATSLAQASAEINFHPEYVETIAKLAYLWGYPMVNMMNRSAKLAAAPEPGRLNGVLPASPIGQIAMLNDYIDPGQTFIACPNQDVVYGLGFMSLDEHPVVMQIPEFGDRFWVYAIYDARTDQVGRLGRPYNTRPGFYLLVGPDWQGEVPAGITEVIRSSTALANVIPRIFMDDTDEDRAAIQSLVNQVMVYPLTEFTGEMRTKDWANAPSFGGGAQGGGETKWVEPDKFFDQLATVLETVPPLPGEETLYSQFTALLDAAKESADLKRMMIAAARDMDDTLIKDFLRWEYNGKPAGNGWNRSLHNAEWGLDYFDRTGTSRSNMFDNRPDETQYYYTDYDSDREPMTGDNTYAITFAAGESPPVKGFWSMTLYDEHHFFHPNDLNRYSLGTKNKTLKYNDDGSLTLYAGNRLPGPDKVSNWLPAPTGAFSLYIRAYWGKEAITSGSWKPPLIVKE